MVTFLGRPGQGATQVEKSLLLNWATQFLTVEYDGACFPYVSVRWHEFPSASCLVGKKKNLDSTRLDVVEIPRVNWHASFKPLLQKKACNSAHEQTLLSYNAIDSVLRHTVVCRTKDFSAAPCTYHEKLRDVCVWILHCVVVVAISVGCRQSVFNRIEYVTGWAFKATIHIRHLEQAHWAAMFCVLSF